MAAANCLDEAVANNFLIRDNPLFMLIKGEVEYSSGNYEQALQTMQAAYDLPGVTPGSKFENKQASMMVFGDKDRCAIYLTLGKAYAANKKVEEAK